MNSTYEELISAIEHKCGSLALADIKDNDDGRIDFFNDFFERFSIKKTTTLTEIRSEEVLLAYLLEGCSESFEELKQRVEKVKDLLNTVDGQSLYELGEFSLKLSDETISKIEEYLHEKKLEINYISKVKRKKEIEKIFGTDESSEFTKLLCNDQLECAVIELLELMVLFKKLKNINHIGFMAFVGDIKRSPSMFEFDNDIDPLLSMFGFGDMYKEILKEQVNQKTVEDMTNVLYRYYNSLLHEQRNEEKRINKKMYSYKQLLKILEIEEKQPEIKNIDNLLDKITDDDIRNKCLQYIYSHNKKYYDNLETEYKYKIENSISGYISCFNEKGIDFNLLSQEEQQKIMQKDIKTVNKIMELLKPISLSKNQILEIIKQSELEIVEELNHYLEKGYINVEIIKRNINVYYDKEILNNLKDNIRFLLDKKVNLMMTDNKEFLLTGTLLITKNITILENVGIDISKLKEFSMLKEMNLQEKINSLIEVGLEEIIRSKPEILNADKNLAKRIVIARLVGMDIIQDGNINESIIEKDNFFVRDGDIDSYLFDRDNSNYNTELIIEFDSSISKDCLSYVVEGIIIPKARVTNLCIPLNQIIRPSLYTQEEVKILEKHMKAEK